MGPTKIIIIIIIIMHGVLYDEIYRLYYLSCCFTWLLHEAKANMQITRGVEDREQQANLRCSGCTSLELLKYFHWVLNIYIYVRNWRAQTLSGAGVVVKRRRCCCHRRVQILEKCGRPNNQTHFQASQTNCESPGLCRFRVGWNMKFLPTYI